MAREPIPSLEAVVRLLSRDILQVSDQQVMRIVATVDAMPVRGPADQLLVPLRHRLALLRPPRPLRLPRLIFHPLRPLIVAAACWRIGQHAIPRSVIVPIADHVRRAMGAAGIAIEAGLAGRTTSDTELIAGLGRSLWPAAAAILAGSAIPKNWIATDLADTIYRPLADIVATLLAEAPALQTLSAETATGLLPPRPEVVAAIVSRVAGMNPAALPTMIALLLDSVPQAGGLLTPGRTGASAVAMGDAIEAATDTLLRLFDSADGTETMIVRATLPDAGAATSRIVALLAHFADAAAKPARRVQLRILRQRLDADCKARFAAGLRDELLMPLQRLGAFPDPEEILALETAAHDLRVLETAARAVGSGPAYDHMLGQAAAAIIDNSMRDKLALADRVRLVEILAGSGAALAMLDQRR